MKNFMKGCAVTALILIVIGLILTVVVNISQGPGYLNDFLASNEITKKWLNRLEEPQSDITKLVDELDRLRSKTSSDDYEYDYAYEYEYENDYDYSYETGFALEEGFDLNEATMFSDSFEIYNGDVSKMMIADSSNVSSLDLSIGGCKFYIKESDDDNFYVEGTNVGKLQAYVKDDTLKLNALRSTKIWDDIQNCRIVLYIPGSYNFTDIDIEFGAGTMDLGSLRAEEINLEAGAGSIQAEFLYADEIKVSLGAGQIYAAEFETDKLTAVVGAGTMEMIGVVGQEAKLECAAGNISMILDGDVTDYDYKIESVLGTVNLDGQGYSGLASTRKIDNGADKEIKLNCSVGNITVEFR